MLPSASIIAIELKKARDEKKAVKWVLENGGWVEFDTWFHTARSVQFLEFAEDSLSFQNLPAKRLSDLSPLGELSNLRDFTLRGTQVRDLTPLASLTNLQTISLSRTPVSDLSPRRA